MCRRSGVGSGDSIRPRSHAPREATPGTPTPRLDPDLTPCAATTAAMTLERLPRSALQCQPSIERRPSRRRIGSRPGADPPLSLAAAVTRRERTPTHRGRDARTVVSPTGRLQSCARTQSPGPMAQSRIQGGETHPEQGEQMAWLDPRRRRSGYCTRAPASAVALQVELASNSAIDEQGPAQSQPSFTHGHSRGRRPYSAAPGSGRSTTV